MVLVTSKCGFNNEIHYILANVNLIGEKVILFPTFSYCWCHPPFQYGMHITVKNPGWIQP